MCWSSHRRNTYNDPMSECNAYQNKMNDVSTHLENQTMAYSTVQYNTVQSVSTTIRPFDRPSAPPSVRPSVHQSVRLSVRPSVRSTLRLSVCQTLRPSDKLLFNETTCKKAC